MTSLMDAVAAAAADVPRLYPLGEVPTEPEYPYGTFHVSLGRGDAYTLDSAHGTRHGMAVVQTFARTADGAIELVDQCVARLLDRRLLATDWETTPLRAAYTGQMPYRASDPESTGVITVTCPLMFVATPKEP